MHLNTLSTPEAVLSAAQRSLRQAVEGRQGKPLLLMLAGGSAFSLLDASLAELLDASCVLMVLDERFSMDPSINNFAQLSHTAFFHAAERRDVGYIDSRIHEDEDVHDVALRFEALLRAWCAAHPDGEIIATMGIGPDGHIAGVMPFPENPSLFASLFLEADRWVVGYDAGQKNPYPVRMTTTLPFLRERVTCAVVYAIGGEKQAALQRCTVTQGILAETPARILREIKRVDLFTDCLL